MLASGKFDLEETSNMGFTSLEFSIGERNREITQLLLEHGSQITEKIFCRYPQLFLPTHSSNSEFDQWFKKYIADNPNKKRDDTIKLYKQQLNRLSSHY